MKIAQVPPLYEAVPPKLYGGTERVVSYLTEELIKQGHEVTLFGTEDSITNATLFPVIPTAIRLNSDCRDAIAWHVYQLQLVLDNAKQFDIIHFHNDYLHYPISRSANYVHVTTLHGRLDLPDLEPIYTTFTDVPLVSISDYQRKPYPDINWAKTIYHGLPLNLYKQGNGNGNYFAFLGRISPEKRPDRAIEIAIKSGIPLKIAAKIDSADMQYYEQVIKPLLEHPLIEFIGEIGEDKKGQFLGDALAMLFPIDWPEPFGMVMIEAMANGTPVIAFNCGSVAEIIDNEETGYIVNSIDEALQAVQKLSSFNRKLCRRTFEKRFSADIMAKSYVDLYKELIDQKAGSSLKRISRSIL
ncbi:MAG: glycosyltransferase family 4 protein [Flavipsychrobacter sp.]